MQSEGAFSEQGATEGHGWTYYPGKNGDGESIRILEMRQEHPKLFWGTLCKWFHLHKTVHF